jgi:hypothetical protein
LRETASDPTPLRRSPSGEAADSGYRDAMNSQPKEKPIPVRVPWGIDTGAPFLSLQASRTGEPLSATFVAYFRCDEQAATKPTPPDVVGLSQNAYVASEPPEFVASSLDDKAAYRLVRVLFTEGLTSRKSRAVSDSETVRAANYDWSAVATVPRPGELLEDAVRRAQQLWFLTGLCPSPRMYQIEHSIWLQQLGLSQELWKHYLLLGIDDYWEVVAQGWTWLAGQRVE